MSLKSNELVYEFFRFLGLPESKFIVDEKISDIYTLLGIEPEFYEDGTRKLTPYEIIGVPPQFYSDGAERPIVFILKRKNVCKKLGKLASENTEFIYKDNKVKDKKEPLADLVARYKSAVLQGNDADAEELLSMINTLSGGRANEILKTFFNYRKYYKTLQKQLLMDIFAHFFINYIYSKVKEVKGGLLKKEKVFKPFKLTVETLSPNGGQNIAEEITASKSEISSDSIDLKSISVMQDTFDFEDLDVDIKQEINENKPQNIVNSDTQNLNPQGAETEVKPVDDNIKHSEDDKADSPSILDILFNDKNVASEENETLDYKYSDMLEISKFQSEIEMKPTYEDTKSDLEFENLQKQLGEFSNVLDFGENTESAKSDINEETFESENLINETNINEPYYEDTNIAQNYEDVESTINEDNEISDRESVIKNPKTISVKKYGLTSDVELKENFKIKKADESEKDEGLELQEEKNLN